MNSELYTAASGLVVEHQRLDVIANNLANVSTHGYRSRRLYSVAFERSLADATGNRASTTAVAAGGTWVAPGSGPLMQTGRPLDVALADGEFLAVRTPRGVRYTRDGSLQVAGDGRLLDGGGNPVLGAAGEPLSGLGAGASLQDDGRVVESGKDLGKLKVVRDAAGLLQPEGGNLFAAAGRDAELDTVEEPRLSAGWIERSATDPMAEMVRMIAAERAFESYQKIVSLTMNEVNRRAVNDLAG